MAALLVAHNRPGFYFRVVEEGEVEAGGEIVRAMQGQECMTVAEVNGLLYKPGHPAHLLEKTLRNPALSVGWRASFKALLDGAGSTIGLRGNPGLGPPGSSSPAWGGFRPLRVIRKTSESSTVTSIKLEPSDGRPVAVGLPGQFVVLRLHPTPEAAPLLRSYSLSGIQSDVCYRISVKCNPGSVAGAYIRDDIQIGDILEVSAPRGSFTLEPGEGAVVLLGAGIGATPVLAMLHALAANRSTRDVWWIYGTSNAAEQVFAGEVRSALACLPRSYCHIGFSAPRADDRLGIDFDGTGRINVSMFDELGVPGDADLYMCGPPAFISDVTDDLRKRCIDHGRIHSEIFGASSGLTPGIAAAASKAPHPPVAAGGPGPLLSFARSDLIVHWAPAFQSILELAEACDVPVRWSCRTGVYHNCETALIEGNVNYRPTPIDQPTDSNILLCCSQPKSDIVLDL